MTYRMISRGIALVLAGLGLALASVGASAQSTAPAAAATPAVATSKAKGRYLPLTGVPTLAKLREGGVLRVGVAVNAPFVMHDKEGQAIGYSVDLARRLAASMGWKLQLVETSWPNLISGLRSNDYDVVISGLSITPQRALDVRFSLPVGEFDVNVVANRDKFPAGGLGELGKLADAKVGARHGALTEGYARDALPGRDVVAIETEGGALADLLDGKLTAYVAEAPLPQVMAQAHADKLRLLEGPPLARTAHGIAVRPDDATLLRVIDAWIVQERASGWLRARDEYWFKGTSWGSQL